MINIKLDVQRKAKEQEGPVQLKPGEFLSKSGAVVRPFKTLDLEEYRRVIGEEENEILRAKMKEKTDAANQLGSIDILLKSQEDQAKNALKKGKLVLDDVELEIVKKYRDIGIPTAADRKKKMREAKE